MEELASILFLTAKHTMELLHNTNFNQLTKCRQTHSKSTQNMQINTHVLITAGEYGILKFFVITIKVSNKIYIFI